MSDFRFPDVPFLPGVPSVLRTIAADPGSVVNSAANVAIGAAQQAASGVISNVQAIGTDLVNGAFGEAASFLGADSPDVSGLLSQGTNQWGIFKGSTQVLVPDSFKELDYHHDWRVANYPMELGAFQSYNKVQTPFEVPIRLTKGGTDSDREEFLTTLESIADGVELYDVVTPDFVYNNVTIQSIGYHRGAREGVKLLTIDIGITEIRVVAAESFVDTASPAYADAVNGGIVQGIAITASSVGFPALTGALSTVTSQITSVGLPFLPPLPFLPTLPALPTLSNVIQSASGTIAARLGVQ